MSRAKKVLYIDHTSVLAGGEIALLNLVRNLDRARFTPQAALLSDGPLAAELKRADCPVHILPADSALLQTKKNAVGLSSIFTARAAATTVLTLRRLIHQTNADLVHTNSLKSNLLGGVAARIAGRPLLWHIRDRIETDYLSLPATKLVRGLAQMLPTHIIANSRATLDTLHLDNPSSASVIYSGLDLSPFLNLPLKRPDFPRIGMIGRLTPWKGQHIFLQAAATIHAKFPSARFQIVGGPLFGEADYEKSLHAQAQSLGIAPVTEFTGHRDDVPALLAGMDIVVHASITPEPFGQVIVIAMAAGKPVIATNGGGVPEIIKHNQNGLLVPMANPAALADAIAYILNDPAAAQSLAASARQRAANFFTIQRTSSQTMDLYDAVLS